MSSVYLIIVSVATVIYCLYLYFTRTFYFWRNQNVAGPRPLPVFGNLLDSTLRRVPIMIVMKKIYDEFPDEKIVGVYRMTSPNLLIRDPDLLKQVMIKDFDNFVDRGVEFDKDGLGLNLFHANEEMWRILRNKFTPIFTSGKLKNMLYLITERGDHFINHVEELTQTESEQEVYQLVQTFTMMTIAACAFGLDVDINDQSGVLTTLKNLDKKVFTANYSIELDMMYPGIFNKIGGSIFPAEVKRFFNDLVKQVIIARQGMPTNRKDFMDLLLELKLGLQVKGTKRMGNEEKKALEVTEVLIAAQAFVFFIAGYETSASTLGYLLMLLALNPDVQDKCVAEIKEVLAQHDDKLTYDALNDMVYLERVFDETLRLYPIVDPLQRKVATDYKIPGTNATVKKGQLLLVSVNGLHNDAKYWPNPSKFDPDRFTPENNAKRHPAVYLPFGIGPRNCIGMRFAKVQSRVCLVKLLQHFRLEATEHTRRNFQYDPYRLVLSPIGGFKMRLLKRD